MLAATSCHGLVTVARCELAVLLVISVAGGCVRVVLSEICKTFCAPLLAQMQYFNQPPVLASGCCVFFNSDTAILAQAQTLFHPFFRWSFHLNVALVRSCCSSLSLEALNGKPSWAQVKTFQKDWVMVRSHEIECPQCCCQLSLAQITVCPCCFLLFDSS